jgi:hypothetical protein
MKVIDMKIQAARDAIRIAKGSAASVYQSTIAIDYDPNKQ